MARKINYDIYELRSQRIKALFDVGQGKDPHRELGEKNGKKFHHQKASRGHAARNRREGSQ